MLSADVAHGIHPNYAGKHEQNHGPMLNQGTVIKSNSNQRYATSATTGFVVRELSRMADLGAPQEFVVRHPMLLRSVRACCAFGSVLCAYSFCSCVPVHACVYTHTQ